ncbi:MAG: hypothetical protein ACI4M4_04840 [Candidatus Ornithospirochaeta sp.]
MKKRSRAIFTLISLCLILLMVSSCAGNQTMDGSTKDRKKEMTSSEYSDNRKALEGMAVAEAYVIANKDDAKSNTRSLGQGSYRYSFDIDTDISSDKLKAELQTSSYAELAATLPSGTTLTAKKGSYVNFSVDDKGIILISSLDLTIVIDDKTIEIEKDEDENWLEIDGTFFDNTQIEEMLERAEDAAEAIEEFFENIGTIISFTTLVEGNSQECNITIGDEEKTISGTTTLSCVDDTLKVTLKAEYTELEDDGKTIDESFTLDVSLTINILDIKNFNEIDLTKLGSFSVKVDGIEVWRDAFISSLD